MKTDEEIKEMTIGEVEDYLEKSGEIMETLKRSIPMLKALDSLRDFGESLEGEVEELEYWMDLRIGRPYPLHFVIGGIMEWFEDNQDLLIRCMSAVIHEAQKCGIDVEVELEESE